MAIPTFVLASASPARRRLLQNAGITPVVRVSDFDESQVQATDPAQLVQTLARCKAETVAAQVKNSPEFLGEHANAPLLVLGCDSVLALEGEIHGKPANATEAIARWQQMRGQVGELFTGHALLDLSQPRDVIQCQVTRVHFATVSDRQIEAYAATGEPLACAGCFALEGKGGLFVEKLEGCHSNVIGLSMPLLRQMLADLGYEVTDFWQLQI